MPNYRINERVKDVLRAAYGLTADDFHERVEIPPSTWFGHHKDGRQFPKTIKTVGKIAAEFELTLPVFVFLDSSFISNQAVSEPSHDHVWMWNLAYSGNPHLMTKKVLGELLVDPECMRIRSWGGKLADEAINNASIIVDRESLPAGEPEQPRMQDADSQTKVSTSIQDPEPQHNAFQSSASPRWLLFGSLATAVLICGVILLWVSLLGRSDPRQQFVAPFELDISLQIMAGHEKSVPIEAADLPICETDAMQVRVRSNQPCYLYLLWLDAAGEVTPLAPWQNFNWEQLQGVDQQSLESFPDGRRHFNFSKEEAGGLHAMIAIALAEPLSDPSQIQHWFSFADFEQGGKLNPKDDATIFRIVDGEVVASSERSAKTLRTRIATDPSSVLLDQLVTQSRERDAKIVAYVFPFGERI